jgi:hypothetical protein
MLRTRSQSFDNLLALSTKRLDDTADADTPHKAKSIDDDPRMRKSSSPINCSKVPLLVSHFESVSYISKDAPATPVVSKNRSAKRLSYAARGSRIIQLQAMIESSSSASPSPSSTDTNAIMLQNTILSQRQTSVKHFLGSLLSRPDDAESELDVQAPPRTTFDPDLQVRREQRAPLSRLPAPVPSIACEPDELDEPQALVQPLSAELASSVEVEPSVVHSPKPQIEPDTIEIAPEPQPQHDDDDDDDDDGRNDNQEQEAKSDAQVEPEPLPSSKTISPRNLVSENSLPSFDHVPTSSPHATDVSESEREYMTSDTDSSSLSSRESTKRKRSKLTRRSSSKRAAAMKAAATAASNATSLSASEDSNISDSCSSVVIEDDDTPSHKSVDSDTTSSDERPRSLTHTLISLLSPRGASSANNATPVSSSNLTAASASADSSASSAIALSSGTAQTITSVPESSVVATVISEALDSITENIFKSLEEEIKGIFAKPQLPAYIPRVPRRKDQKKYVKVVLEQVAKNDTEITDIIFTHCGLSHNGVRRLERAMRTNTVVSKLDLSNFALQNAESDLPLLTESLASNSSITWYVSLTHTHALSLSLSVALCLYQPY